MSVIGVPITKRQGPQANIIACFAQCIEPREGEIGVPDLLKCIIYIDSKCNISKTFTRWKEEDNPRLNKRR